MAQCGCLELALRRLLYLRDYIQTQSGQSYLLRHFSLGKTNPQKFKLILAQIEKCKRACFYQQHFKRGLELQDFTQVCDLGNRDCCLVVSLHGAAWI